MIGEHTGRLDALEQQVTDLQDRSRRSNLRLLGLPEGAEKDDPIGFLRWIPSLAGRDIEIERAHRVYSRASMDHSKPRVFLFKLLRYNDRNLIFNEARRRGPVKANDFELFPRLLSCDGKEAKLLQYNTEGTERGRPADLSSLSCYAEDRHETWRDQTNAFTGRSASIPELHSRSSFSWDGRGIRV